MLLDSAKYEQSHWNITSWILRVVMFRWYHCITPKSLVGHIKYFKCCEVFQFSNAVNKMNPKIIYRIHFKICLQKELKFLLATTIFFFKLSMHFGWQIFTNTNLINIFWFFSILLITFMKNVNSTTRADYFFPFIYIKIINLLHSSQTVFSAPP